MAKSGRQAWQLLRRIVGWFPVRLPGLVLVGAALLVTIFIGRAQADYLLYPAGLVAIGLVALALLFVVFATFILWRSLRGAASGVPESLETREAARTTFRFPAFARWPIVEVAMQWEEPAAVAVELEQHGRWYHETVRPRERGRFPRIVRRFTVADIFGLTAISFRRSWDEPVCITPAAAAAGAELTSSYASGDSFSNPAGKAEGDLVEMRRYGHGDPLRHILWKTFARTRRLLVRMPERAVAPMPTTVAFLVAGESDEATAATARLYLERGVLGPDFLFGADGSTRPTRDTREALDQIVDSAHARTEGGGALEAFAGQVEAARLASCLVFAPAVDGPWRERVAAFSQRLPSPATIVIGVSGVVGLRPRSRLARWLVRVPGEDHPDQRALAEIPALRDALEREGMRVQVLHRETGQML